MDLLNKLPYTTLIFRHGGSLIIQLSRATKIELSVKIVNV